MPPTCGSILGLGFTPAMSSSSSTGWLCRLLHIQMWDKIPDTEVWKCPASTPSCRRPKQDVMAYRLDTQKLPAKTAAIWWNMPRHAHSWKAEEMVPRLPLSNTLAPILPVGRHLPSTAQPGATRSPKESMQQKQDRAGQKWATHKAWASASITYQHVVGPVYLQTHHPHP